jgi:hypothetical protein
MENKMTNEQTIKPRNEPLVRAMLSMAQRYKRSFQHWKKQTSESHSELSHRQDIFYDPGCNNELRLICGEGISPYRGMLNVVKLKRFRDVLESYRTRLLFENVRKAKMDYFDGRDFSEEQINEELR